MRPAEGSGRQTPAGMGTDPPRAPVPIAAVHAQLTEPGGGPDGEEPTSAGAYATRRSGPWITGEEEHPDVRCRPQRPDLVRNVPDNGTTAGRLWMSLSRVESHRDSAQTLR